ncbi:unnamed protein product [Lactuca saligna]|uniref:Uncharacterized protein n=1 Tax=Lactuca saligna TaxID=75948 RepID=A0AA35YE97_LACSI|nr:unnamed protein product [Lactuca saligna]
MILEISRYRVFREAGLLRNKGETRNKEQQTKTEADRKGNEASGSDKDKGKGISVDENEEILIEEERAERERSDKELDDLHALRKKFEAKEVETKNVKLVLKIHKSLFHAWSMERIQKEAIDYPSLC